MRYEEAFLKLIQLEGVKYTNYAADLGGGTAYGVTQTAYTTYRTKMGLSQQTVALITHSEAYDLYYREYWLPSHAYQMPDGVDFVLFQAYVNAGPKAIKWLQEAVGVVQDGAVGPKTLQGVADYSAKYGTKALVTSFLEIQKRHYEKRVAEDLTQGQFYKGWLNRISETYAYVSGSLTSAGQAVASAASSVVASASAFVKKNPMESAMMIGLPILLFFCFQILLLLEEKS